MLSGDTPIYLLRDLSKPVTLGELAHKGTFPEAVMSFDGTRITVGWLERVVSCGMAPVKSVIFDDHTGFKATSDQKLLYFDGTPVSIDAVELHKSLMPLYLDKDKHGYPTYRENSGYHLDANTEADCQKVRKVARMVAEAKLSSRIVSNTYVKHIDGNRLNCHPDNLAVTVKSNAKQRKFIHPFIKAVLDANEIIESHPRNHKIVEVSSGGEYANVYGCVVSPMNNVAIGGIFMVTDNDG
jgi:hypothetical protein